MSDDSDENLAPSTNGRPTSPRGTGRPQVYGSLFWHAYVANTCLVVANSLLFRYADFVSYLGGTEFQLGLIVGTGAVGSLVMRVAQGTAIDRCGPRRIWLWSLVAYIGCVLGHLAIARVDGPAIFLARMAYATSLAGAFGASITAVSRRVSIPRMAEVIGTLGSSGFLGMMIGPILGDLLCPNHQVTEIEIHRLFLAAAILGALAFVTVFHGVREAPGRRLRRAPNPFHLAGRYGRGSVMLAAVAMGAGLNLPMYFLRPFTASLGIAGIGLFFGVYCPFAFAVRLSMRGLPERYGNRPLILLGSACTIVGTALFLVVSQAWHLVFPAIVLGAAHALVFPTVTAEGSGAYPERYRGLGTTITLGAFDLGGFIGAPLIGLLLWMADSAGLPKYPTTFVVFSGLLLISGLASWVWSRADAAAKKSKAEARPAPPDAVLDRSHRVVMPVISPVSPASAPTLGETPCPATGISA